MEQIFVYGTLLYPEIVGKLTGKKLKTHHAILFGFKRFTVVGCDYPAIIETKNSKVEGLLIENVDSKSGQVLSFFEGVEYEKRKVIVQTKQHKVEASTYIWKGDFSLLKDIEWNIHDFKKNRLRYYLEDVIPQTLEEFKNGG